MFFGAIATLGRTPRLAATDPQAHPFTPFNHGIPFSPLSEKSCQICHQLEPAAHYKAAFKDSLNPPVFTRNVQNVNLLNCVSCHNSQGAGNRCAL